MLAFFIAVFGALYLILRLGGEKAERTANNKEGQRRLDAKHRFRERFTDYAIENKISERLNDSTQFHAIWDEVMPVFESLPSYTHQERESFGNDSFLRYDIKRILLAKRGKVSYMDDQPKTSEFGIKIHDLSDKKVRQRMFEVLVWCRDEIERTTGAKIRLIVVPWYELGEPHATLAMKNIGVVEADYSMQDVRGELHWDMAKTMEMID